MNAFFLKEIFLTGIVYFHTSFQETNDESAMTRLFLQEEMLLRCFHPAIEKTNNNR
jgi:hypothetical protein